MCSDREILDQVEALFCEKNETPFDHTYDSLIQALSFSRTILDDRGSIEIKNVCRLRHGLGMALQHWNC